MKPIVLVETQSQVLKLLKKYRKENIRWIALTPEAMYCLRKNSIPFSIPEDFYDNQELEMVLKETHQRIYKLCEIGDKLIGKYLPEIEEKGIKPFLFHLHPLKMTLDPIAIIVFQLRRIFNELHFDSIVVCQKKKKDALGFYDFNFNNTESLYYEVLRLAGWKVQRVFISENEISDNNVVRNANKGVKNFVKEQIKKNLFLRNFYYYFNNVGREELLNFLFHCFNRNYPKLVIYRGGHDWYYTLKFFLKRGYLPIFLPGIKKRRHIVKSINFAPESFKRELNELDEFREFFILEGINCYDILSRKIDLIIKRIPEMVERYLEVKDFIFTKKIQSILLNGVATWEYQVVGSAGRANNVPVILWQHGSYGAAEFYNTHEIDFIASDYCFVWGNGAMNMCKQFEEQYHCKIIPIGSAVVDKIRFSGAKTKLSKPFQILLEKVKGKGQKVILYATTNYLQNSTYYGFSPVWSDRLFYLTQEKFLNKLLTLEKIFLIFKLHPNPYWDDPPFVYDLRGNENTLILKNKYTFPELFSVADIIFLDLPTTSLRQAVATNKPLFAFLKYFKYTIEMKVLLSKRAVSSEDEDELLFQLGKYIESGEYPADLNNEEFLREYGTYLNDGKSAERATAEVIHIINENRIK